VQLCIEVPTDIPEAEAAGFHIHSNFIDEIALFCEYNTIILPKKRLPTIEELPQKPALARFAQLRQEASGSPKRKDNSEEYNPFDEFDKLI
jgi:hypothetical protein